MPWRVFFGVGIVLLVAWLAMIIVLLTTRPETWKLSEAARLLPDMVRLLRRLAADPGVPRGVRVRLWLLLAYLAIPVDLIPDFIPVVGYADDAILISLTLRSAIKRAGPDAVRRHWPGTAEGLAALWRITRLPV
jgi:uncharacterized membrane protein YkvA (DUF1232 family)